MCSSQQFRSLLQLSPIRRLSVRSVQRTNSLSYPLCSPSSTRVRFLNSSMSMFLRNMEVAKQHRCSACQQIHTGRGDLHGKEKKNTIQENKATRRQKLLDRQHAKAKSMKEKPQVVYDIPTEPGDKKVTSCPMPDTYRPKYVEAAWYDWWVKEGFFKPREDAPADECFVVCLPPPNVTGTLHLGHTLGSTIQDALARWHRMCGRSVLWIPGCDHAGIATQVVVEKQLWKDRQETRHDLGRQKFVEEVWKWKEQKGDTIYEQMKKLGCSLDWSRAVFTLDPSMSHAVNEAFIRLHDEGLIYRDTRLINWSCSLNSTISDIEVDNHPLEKRTYLAVPGYDKKVLFGVMTTFAYPVVDSVEQIPVSTTRLETMLGDAAVAVHPADDRYRHLHGQRLAHPLCDRTIPIIVDEAVDMSFGTGAVKITPAHDHNDYAMGRRHGLPSLSVIDDAGCMANVPQPFKGMKRFDARVAVLKALAEKGFLQDTADHAMSIPLCSRSGDVVEPMLKEQWYLDCSRMAQSARQVVSEGRLQLIPDHYSKVWDAWLAESRDWCISRQLWWGHQIPAYRATSSEDQEVDVWVSAHTEDEARMKASQKLSCPPDNIRLHRDDDVLDTWFSSALFPFSSLGWPNTEGDYGHFYPTSLLETAGDILFFWVARMVMLGEHLTGKLPFDKVLLHGIIRDSHGRKMSKSLGNIVDPMDVINGISLKDLQRKVTESNLTTAEVKKAQEGQRKDYPLGIAECGADALRFTLVSYQYKAHVLNVNVDHIKSFQNFCNKIWQGFKFCQSHWHATEYPALTEHQVVLGNATDVWILSRLSHLVSVCDTAFKELSLNQATQALHLFWQQDFCDVYLEYAKTVFHENDLQHSHLVESVLHECVSVMLRCLSPFMPYLSEELYQRLPGQQTCPSVCVSEYPQPSQYPWRSELIEDDMATVREVVTELLSLRSELRLTKERPKVWLETCDPCLYDAVKQHRKVLTVLSRSCDIQVAMEPCGDEPAELDINREECVEVDIGDTCRAYMELKDVLDIDKTLEVLDRQLASLESEKQQLLQESQLDGDDSGGINSGK